MSELSDYKRIIEKPMIESYEATIRANGALIAKLRAVVDAARAMPRATPAPGGCSTKHTFEIEAGAVWTLDQAFNNLDKA